jgi:hypothetical protein
MAAAPAATPSPSPAPAQRTATPAGEAAPAPAAPQRSAALSQPAEQQLQPQPRRRDAARAHRANQPPAPAREPSQLGVVGPQTWPNAYEDILGYALWPEKYGERIKAHGIGDVMSLIFAPQNLAAAGGQALVRSADANPSDAGGAGAACGTAAQTVDWPARQIEQSIELTEPQRAKLAELRTAVGDGVSAIRATCRDGARTSADRLRAMQHTLWAVRDATILIRAPLVDFYSSLTAEQKKQFIVQASQPDPRMAHMDSRAMSRGQQSVPPQLARMCGMAGANEWPMRQIEHSIRPNRAQRASLEALQKKSGEMGQLLMASCLQATPATPDVRVDAAVDRLTALLFAVTNVSLAFNDFYGQLNEEQKSQLGSFGL